MSIKTYQVEPLKSAIDSEPVNSSRTDAQVFAWLTELAIETWHTDFMTSAGVMNRLGSARGAEVLDGIVLAASGGNSPAKWTLEFINQRGLDIGTAEARLALAGFSAAGLYDGGELDKLIAPARTMISRMAELSITNVTVHDLPGVRS